MNYVWWPSKPFIEVSNPSSKDRRKTVVNTDLAAMATDENFSWDVIHHHQRPVVPIELKSYKCENAQVKKYATGIQISWN